MNGNNEDNCAFFIGSLHDFPGVTRKEYQSTITGKGVRYALGSISYVGRKKDKIMTKCFKRCMCVHCKCLRVTLDLGARVMPGRGAVRQCSQGGLT